jgi:uncharacterized protein YkwD
MNIYTGRTNGILNRTTILLVLLIVTSLFLPATAIMYASGSPENNTAPPSGFTENNAAPPSGFTENNAAPPSGPTGTNDTLNPLSSGLRIESNNTGVCSPGNVCVSGGEFADTILTLINQERALVGVPPLTWNNTLAADAQTYADYLETTGKTEHPSAEWVAAHPMALEGENLYFGEGGDQSPKNLAQMAFDGWFAEKADYQGQQTGSEGGVTIGHYTQMVWKSTTQIGCAAVTGKDNPANNLPYDRVSCRFTPPGNVVGQTPY